MTGWGRTMKRAIVAGDAIDAASWPPLVAHKQASLFLCLLLVGSSRRVTLGSSD
jgi:hypothetical protein